MSNIIAGIGRGQLPYAEEHKEQKKKIYFRYKEGLKDLPVSMNPYDAEKSEPNFWLSCLLIDEDAKGMFSSVGTNVNIEKGAIISTKSSIGNNSGIGVDAECGEIHIGNDVMMGRECIATR